MTCFKRRCIIPSLLLMFAITIIGCKKNDLPESGTVKTSALYSALTGYTYKIQVLLPANYDPNNSYHTIYLLDGDDYFEEMADVVKAQFNDNAVLVAIGYQGKNKRTTDFTYPADGMISGSGGGIRFLNFLTGELVPYVQSLGIRATQNTLLGHSLGAYIGLYLSFQTEIANPFDHVIAISPSIFWNQAHLFALEQRYFTAHKDLDLKLYMAVGDIEGLTMNTHFRAFVKKLADRKYNNLVLYAETLSNTSHNNSPVIGFKKGLQTIK